MPSTPIALQARYVFPVAGPPLAGGVVTIQDGNIVAVGNRDSLPAGVDCHDLGSVALLPALVNAHTHLEFSDLSTPLGRPGLSLPAWIREVIAHRQSDASEAGGPSAVERGLRESLEGGTGLIGEIAQATWNPDHFEHSPVVSNVFLEFIGLSPDRIAAAETLAREHLKRRSRREHWAPGLSPHAPYTVHRDLLGNLVELAVAQRATVAMHLAESHEEIELLRSGEGPFRDLLDERGVWQPGAIPTAARPLDYLQVLQRAPRCLVVHGNYLADDEMDYLAAHAERMAVVYCPRTHAYFGHSRYPLVELLRSGVRVAVGTDSRASNPDLSILAELRYIAGVFPELSPDEILRLGTQQGAAALGWPRLGTLEVGQRANLAAVALAEDDRRAPFDQLFDSTLPVVGTMIDGRWRHGPGTTSDQPGR